MNFKSIYTTVSILGFGMLSACISLTDHTVTVSQAQIQHKLTEKLADPIPILEVFQLQLSNPSVTLDAVNDRIKVMMDAQFNGPLMPALRGNAALSGRLRFDAASNAVLLTEPKIESLNIDALGSRNKELLTALAGRLGEDWLDNYPLYTLKPDELTVLGIRLTPTQMKISAQGLEVTLEPK